jgi:hypothetical protein
MKAATPTQRLSRVLTCALIFLCSAAPKVVAQVSGEDDFSPENRDWNGLSSLMSIVGAAGQADVSPSEPVATSEVLWLIQPAELDAELLYEWVASGGRLLIADESGVADEFLGLLGLVPTDDSWEHDQFLQGDPELPIVTAAGVHPLSMGAARLVANHPRSIDGPGRAVYGFEEGGGLVWDISLGRGRAVVVADPSLLINLMLPIEENAAFLTNVVAYLCPEGPCPHVIVAANPMPELQPADTGEGGRSEFATILDDALDSLTDIQIDPPLLWLANLLLALGAAVILWTMFPRIVQAALTALPRHWPRAMRSSMDQELSRYTGELAETSFVRPAAQLARVFTPLYDRGATRWGVPMLGGGPEVESPRALARAWVARMEGTSGGFGVSRRIRELEWMFSTLQRLPHGPSMPVQTATLSRDDFMRLYDLCREVLEKMEMHGEFDRAGQP